MRTELNHMILTLASTLVTLASGLEYQTLQDTGAGCPLKDSCRGMGPASFDDRNCECDGHCTAFNDCCIDAAAPPRWNSRRMDCMPYSLDSAGAYAVGCCPRGYTGPLEIRRGCQNPGFHDPLAAAPVTDTYDNITYRNRYCAECNAAQPSRLKSWLITIDCDSCDATLNASETLRNMRYAPAISSWGVDLDGEFHPFHILFNKPNYLMARRCRPGLVSHCPRNYVTQDARRLCESYTAVTKYRNNVYKNPHCVMCNHPGATGSAMTCYSGEGIVSRKKPFSFALLLDVNQSDGNKVGEVSKCPSGQKYDPFFKKCRPLVCAVPGYVKEGGKCVKKASA